MNPKEIEQFDNLEALLTAGRASPPAVEPLTEQLADLVRWTLGEHPTEMFPSLPDDWPARKFYWRAELRERFEALLTAGRASQTGTQE